MRRYVNVVISPLAEPLTYEVPQSFADRIHIGSYVEIPLGKRKAHGYVIDTYTSEEKTPGGNFQIKPILNLPLPYPFFSSEQLPFFQWIADYYAESLGQVLDIAIPSFPPEKCEKLLIRTDKELSGLGPKQKIILEHIPKDKEISYRELLQRFPRSHTSVRKLEEHGFITVTKKEIADSYLPTTPLPSWAKSTPVDLSEEQRTAASDICEHLSTETFAPMLLHGVTGSGKTEVYIEAIQRALEQDKGVLIIVPEIALTPQLIDRFRARLGDNIGALHSGLSKRKRWDAWRALLEGRCSIALGARSGIFAPVKNLGLIIVDEEHDSSFKQSEGFRYHARDLAIVRGKLLSCPVVLGSATPSLESYYNAGTKKYHYHRLSQRQAKNQALDISVIDLNKFKRKDMPSPNISPDLFQELQQTLERGEQAFLLYNRRGFATYLQCDSCGSSAECPNCAVTLTYHRSKHTLLCHYCGIQIVPPQYCSSCVDEASFAAAGGSDVVMRTLDDDTFGKLQQRGAGTEKVFEELKELLPGVRIDRLDRDTTQHPDEYRAVLDRMRSGETQLLVGTQMIAKGHDIPNVTLVGVIDCDVGLHMPDFRASERIFQLLVQTAGRAGRGDHPGKVFLQTRMPEHPSILRTKDHDFKAYAKAELQLRKAAFYPPFSKMLRVVSSSQDRSLALSLLKSHRSIIEENISQGHIPDTFILGPISAPFEKLKTKWRYHLLIKSTKSSVLNKFIRILKKTGLPSTKLKVTYDLDPQDML